jgi:hypothetical protein
VDVVDWRIKAILLGVTAVAPRLVEGQQSTIALEAGLQLTYWHLDAGGFNRVGPTAHVGVFFPEGTPIALRVVTSYAPQGARTPGVFALGVQAGLQLLASKADGLRSLALEGLLGFGGLRYSGTTGIELENPCGPAACIEGVFFRGGWSKVAELGVGLTIPLDSRLVVQPSAALLIPLGDTRDGPGHSVLRAGVGIGWR